MSCNGTNVLNLKEMRAAPRKPYGGVWGVQDAPSHVCCRHTISLDRTKNCMYASYMRDQKTKPISVRLPADLVDSVETIAKRDFSTVTSIVGRALNLFVEKDRAASEGYTAFLANLNQDAALDYLLQSASEVTAPREAEIKVESQDLMESEETKSE